MKKLITFLLLTMFVFAAQAQQENLDEYKGVYKFKDGAPTGSVEISVQSGALYASSSLGSAALSKIAKDTFSIPDYGGMVYFFRNDKGEVSSIRVEVNNLVMEGEKEQKSLAWLRRRAVVSK